MNRLIVPVLLVLTLGCRGEPLPFESDTDPDTDTDSDTVPAFARVAGDVLLPDGSGAEGALVAVDGLSEVTDDTGHFVFPEVSPGDHTVRAELGGYHPATADISVVAGEPTSVTLNLTALEDEAPLVTALSASPLPVPRGGTASLLATATADDLTWAWSVTGDFTVVDDGDGTATLVAPNAPSVEATVTVTATNGDGASDDATLLVTTAVNAVPTIDVTVAPILAEPGASVSLTAVVDDADDDDLDVTWTSDWTVVGTGTAVTLTAPDAPGASGTATATVTDPWGATASRTVQVLTRDNAPPTIASVVADPIVLQRGGTSTLTVTAQDPEGGDLTYAWTGPWDIGSPSAAVTTVTGPDAPGQAGTFTVTVTDEAGATATGEVRVNTLGNRAPVINGTSAQPNPSEPGQTIQLSVTAVDADGDGMEAVWSADAAWSLVDQGVTATLTAPDARGATTAVSVTVTDDHGASATSTFDVGTAANLAPVVASVLAVPGLVDLGGDVALSVDASDPNGDALTYAWEVPAGWTLSSDLGATATVTAPDSASSGVVRVVVSDAYGGSAAGSVPVRTDDTTPSAIELPAVSDLDPGQIFDLSATLTGLDPDAFTFVWTVLGDGWTATYTGPDAQITAALPGGALSARIIVTATDGTTTLSAATDAVVTLDGASCQELADNGAGSGIYWLTPDGSLDAAWPTACEMDPDGTAWTLLYKRSAGVPSSDVPGQFTAGSLNPYDTSLLDRDQETADFVGAAIPGAWGQFTEGRFEIVDDGAVVQWMHYDLAGSTPADFFSKDRLIASSWFGMVSEHHGDGEFWTLQGHASNQRHWYINRAWGGCPNDQGWLLVQGDFGGGCSFDQNNAILYSTSDHVENLTTGAVDHAEAVLLWARVAPAGRSRDTAVASCADVTGTDTWWLDPDGDGGIAPYQAFCDDGWQLVYKKTSGVATDPADLWRGGNTHVADPDALSRDAHIGDYANASTTTGFGAFSEARVEVLVDGAPVKTLTFDLAGRTNLDWFSMAAMTSNPWDDLEAASPNYFGIDGHASINRHFFVNNNYGGCSSDAGWLVANGTTSCSWETAWTVKYVPGPVRQNWTTGDIARADALAVFMR